MKDGERWTERERERKREREKEREREGGTERRELGIKLTHKFGESSDGYFASTANKLEQAGAFLIIHLTNKLQKNRKKEKEKKELTNTVKENQSESVISINQHPPNRLIWPLTSSSSQTGNEASLDRFIFVYLLIDLMIDFFLLLFGNGSRLSSLRRWWKSWPELRYQLFIASIIMNSAHIRPTQTFIHSNWLSIIHQFPHPLLRWFMPKTWAGFDYPATESRFQMPPANGSPVDRQWIASGFQSSIAGP